MIQLGYSKTVDFIIPTMDNLEQLKECVDSLLASRALQPIRIILVNNGKAPLDKLYEHYSEVKVLMPGKNLGWEGGLKLGLEHSDSEFVVFANDDIYIPFSSNYWLRGMIRIAQYHNAGAVGPKSNLVMGTQNIWSPFRYPVGAVMFLIGFCMLVRRKALDEAGGIDDNLPGGDDLDLSIRLRDKGWKLLIDNSAFVYHHGFQTGTKLHGGAGTPGGWNSPQMTEKTNTALIQKHGFLKWYNLFYPEWPTDEEHTPDSEGIFIREYVVGKAVDLGCGATKTTSDAIGIDRVPKGEVIPNLSGALSVADIVASVDEPLPLEDESVDTLIARHILEHVLDPIKVMKEWVRIVKKGGRIAIAVPNEKILEGIPINPEHLHAFTRESLQSLMSVVRCKEIAFSEYHNDISFVGIYEKLL